MEKKGGNQKAKPCGEAVANPMVLEGEGLKSRREGGHGGKGGTLSKKKKKKGGSKAVSA